jgi:hypothetical protein
MPQPWLIIEELPKNPLCVRTALTICSIPGLSRKGRLHVVDSKQVLSLAEFNEMLRAYIYQHNNTVYSSTKVTPLERFLTTKEHIRKPKSQEWLDECFHNRIIRKVNNDATVSIDGVYYDVPPQFIKMKVEIRYLPDNMENAYILYEKMHFPIVATDKVANSKTKRNNKLPLINY